MRLLPIRAPRFGLAFSSRAVTLVERARRGRGLARPTIRWSRESRLPGGLLLPSDRAPNIMDLEALTAEVRDMLAPLRGQTVALSLPDQAAQMALFEFDTLPRDAGEREALLRWRFREDGGFSSDDAHLAYHVYADRRPSAGSEATSSGMVRVLAVSVQREVLAQYEQWCEGIGLLPLSIGIGSLDLFDLCRALMPPQQDIFFAHCSSDGCAFLAASAGVPTLVRVKHTHGARMNVATELLGTLQYYEDLAGDGGGAAERPDPCVWLVDTRGERLEEAEPADAPRPEPPLAEELRLGFRSIAVHHLGWDMVAAPKTRAQEFPVSGLPALAGMVAA